MLVWLLADLLGFEAFSRRASSSNQRTIFHQKFFENSFLLRRKIHCEILVTIVIERS
jgi:hypothetical protein